MVTALLAICSVDHGAHDDGSALFAHDVSNSAVALLLVAVDVDGAALRAAFLPRQQRVALRLFPP